MLPALYYIWLLVFLMLCLPGTHGQKTVDISIESNPHFIGWYLGPTGTQALTDPNTWTTSGTYAAGCSGSACSFATLCTANTLFYNNNESLVCTSARCYTMTIYEAPPYGGPSASNLFCAQAWNANTVYRELPAASTTSSSKSSLTTAAITSSPTVTSIHETSAATTPSTTPTTRETLTSSSSGSPSKAWIAGPVVGAVVGIAIIVSGAIFFLSRKQRRTFQPQAQYDTGSGYPYGGCGDSVQQQQKQQQQPQGRHELYQEHFAPKRPATVYELP